MKLSIESQLDIFSGELVVNCPCTVQQGTAPQTAHVPPLHARRTAKVQDQDILWPMADWKTAVLHSIPRAEPKLRRDWMKTMNALARHNPMPHPERHRADLGTWPAA